MLIYSDLLTGDEVATDVMKSTEHYEGAVFSIQAKMIKVSDSVDVGAGNHFGGGDEEDMGDDVRHVIDLVHSHELQKMALTKAEYKAFMKSFYKNLKTKLDEEIADAPDYRKDDLKAQLKKFKADFAQIGAFVKDVSKNFKDYDFYVSQSNSLEGLIIPAKWGSEEAPEFFYIEVALGKTKC